MMAWRAGGLTCMSVRAVYWWVGQAPAGFYDTTDEKEAGKKQALDPTFEALRVRDDATAHQPSQGERLASPECQAGSD